MKKNINSIFYFLLVVGCQSNTYEDTYYLTYFYVEDCLNCQQFLKRMFFQLLKKNLVNISKSKPMIWMMKRLLMK